MLQLVYLVLLYHFTPYYCQFVLYFLFTFYSDKGCFLDYMSEPYKQKSWVGKLGILIVWSMVKLLGTVVEL